MAGDPKDQKTAMLTDVPPEVQAALNRRGPAPAPAPTGGGQRTVMLDAAGGAPAPAPAPAVGMRPPPGASAPLPPVPRPDKPSTAGRWIAGPVLALVFCVGTAYALRFALPRADQKPIKMGKLKLTSDPAGASLTIDGKAFPRFTPTTFEGVAGTTAHIVFKLDGYKEATAEVKITEGENVFAMKLEADKPAVEPPPEPVKPPEPKVEPVVATKDPKDKGKKPKVTAPVATPVDAGKGQGQLSVTVHPWAIVFIDGVKLRQTPVRNYELKSGKHVIELVNETKNRREKIQVTIRPGATEEISREWDK